MVQIIVDKISPRIEYTFKQVFQQFLNVPYEIIEASNSTDTSASFVINYSSQTTINANLQIIPNGLLNEVTYKEIIPTVVVNNDEVKLFLNESPQFGFDVFVAVFWMITRYEEYKNNELDNHNRFPAKNSFAFQNGILGIPIVDVWMHKLKNLINTVFPGLIREKQFTITNTIDVDNAFAYKGKDMLRRIGAFSRDLLKGKLEENKKRKEVLSGVESDPYDTYDYIRGQTLNKNINTIFFHLVGEKAKHDRNIKVNSEVYITLLKKLNEWSTQGLHPSYASNATKDRVKEEKFWLENSLNHKVISSRQHFLMLRFPDTYNSLVDAGIQNDYSMGFADQIGFRAGTAQAFTFFDLDSNSEKPLMIYPFCLMDGTLHDYLKLSPKQAITKINEMVSVHKKYQLPYIAIWHNETLGETNGWEGWREVYQAQFI
jgi:hypothetical protein